MAPIDKINGNSYKYITIKMCQYLYIKLLYEY